MSLIERLYLGLACYSILCTTINLYLLIYKIEIDRARRKDDYIRRKAERKERRERELALSSELNKIYLQVITRR